MTTTAARHLEELPGAGKKFFIDDYPPGWPEMLWTVKLSWLQAHTSPRASYSEAAQILGAHRAAQQRAAHEHSVKRAAAEQVDHAASRMTVETAAALPVQFGKHKGKTLGQVAADDLMYLDWMAGQAWLKGTLLDGVLTLCKLHEREIERRVR
jgi:hypothetical protein